MGLTSSKPARMSDLDGAVPSRDETWRDAGVALEEMQKMQSVFKEAMQALDKHMGQIPLEKHPDIKSCMGKFCRLLQDTQRFSTKTERVLNLELGAIESLTEVRSWDREPAAPLCALLTDSKKKLHKARDLLEDPSANCEKLIQRYLEHSTQLVKVYANLRWNTSMWRYIAASLLAGCLSVGCIAVIAGTVTLPAALAWVVGVGAALGASEATLWRSQQSNSMIAKLQAAHQGLAKAHTCLNSMITVPSEFVSDLTEHDLKSLDKLQCLNNYGVAVRLLMQKLVDLEKTSEQNFHVMGSSQLYARSLAQCQAEQTLCEVLPLKTSAFAERLLDVDSTATLMSPIYGLMQCPLVPLMEAVQPLQPLVPHVVNGALFAMHFVHDKSPSEDAAWFCPAGSPLTEHEIGAIHLYTQDCMYDLLNKALRSADRRNIKPYFGFLRLLMAAISKLPATDSTVSRGIDLDLSGTYIVGCQLTWWAFSSATINSTTVEGFMGGAGKRSVLFIHQVSGRDISRYTAVQGHQEILLTPGFFFKVLEVKGIGGNVTMYTLKEMSLPFDLFPRGCCTGISAPSTTDS